MHRVLVPLGIALILAGSVAAAVLALLPLPTLNALGGPAGWCGPGYTSKSALEVWMNPDMVTRGTDGTNDQQTAEQQQAFKDFCLGEADSRLTEAALALMAGVVLGGAAVVASVVVRPGIPRTY